MVFTTSGMLTKQMSVQHPFGNAADGFGNTVDGSGRPGMDREGLGWIGKAWDGFGFGQGLFGWGLDCE